MSFKSSVPPSVPHPSDPVRAWIWWVFWCALLTIAVILVVALFTTEWARPSPTAPVRIRTLCCKTDATKCVPVVPNQCTTITCPDAELTLCDRDLLPPSTPPASSKGPTP